MGAFCQRHKITPDDEQWKVVMDELTNPDDPHREPFEGQVCPACYVHMVDEVRLLKRNLKIESRQAVHLRAANDRLQAIVDAVILALKNATGKDAAALANQKYPASMLQSQGYPGLMVQHGELANILPNLITEAAAFKAKNEH